MEASPMTCFLSRPVLRQMINELREEYLPSNYQLVGELRHSPPLSAANSRQASLLNEYLVEIFGCEVACLDLLARIENGSDFSVDRVMKFRHLPDKLVPSPQERRVPPAPLWANRKHVGRPRNVEKWKR
jgi:hypothetical protein